MPMFSGFLRFPAALLLVALTVSASGPQSSGQAPVSANPAGQSKVQETSTAPPVHHADEPDPVRETQQTITVKDKLSLVWWIPFEYWGIAAEKAGQSAEKTSQTFIALKDYTVVTVAAGTIGTLGSLTFVPPEDLKKYVVLRDADGNEYLPVKDVSQDAYLVAGVIKPILANALGKLGENLQVLFFPGTGKDGKAIASPTQKGRFSVVVKELAGAPETVFEWRLPLTAYTPPKFCPVGKERVHADWDYCPWHGVALNH
jgi:hypothetical protein